MTALRKPQVSDFSVEDVSTLERIANGTGQPVEQLLTPGIFGVRAHWPGWLEANLDHSLATYLSRGTLPRLAKEAYASLMMRRREGFAMGVRGFGRDLAIVRRAKSHSRTAASVDYRCVG
jgi:hypothetical protein